MGLILLILGILAPIGFITYNSLFKTKYSSELKQIIALSREYAVGLNLGYINTEMFLYSIVKGQVGIAWMVLKNTGFKSDEFTRQMEAKNQATDIKITATENIPLTLEAEICLKETFKHAITQNSNATSVHLLIAYAAHSQSTDFQKQYNLPSTEVIYATLAQPEFAQLQETFEK